MNLGNRIKNDKTVLISCLLLIACLILDLLYFIVYTKLAGGFVENVFYDSICQFIPVFVLFIYVLVFYKTNKIQIVFPIAILSYVLTSIFNIVNCVNTNYWYIDDVIDLIRYSDFLELAIIGCVLLFLILKGIKNKRIFRYLISAMVAYGTFSIFSDMIRMISSGGFGIYDILVVYYIIHDFLYFAVLFIIIPDATSRKGFKGYIKNTVVSVEEELKLLKQQFENEEITEEEYSKAKQAILFKV